MALGAAPAAIGTLAAPRELTRGKSKGTE